MERSLVALLCEPIYWIIHNNKLTAEIVLSVEYEFFYTSSKLTTKPEITGFCFSGVSVMMDDAHQLSPHLQMMESSCDLDLLEQTKFSA